MARTDAIFVARREPPWRLCYFNGRWRRHRDEEKEGRGRIPFISAIIQYLATDNGAALPRVIPATRRDFVTLHDMDDTLEQPKPSPNLNTSGTGDGDHEQDSSGDEDGGLDWTKLPYVHNHLFALVVS